MAYANGNEVLFSADVNIEYVSAAELATKANQSDMEKAQSDINDLFQIVEQGGVVTKTQVSEAYKTRTTAGGISIIDGAKTTVNKIDGETVASRNMVSYPFYETTKTTLGITFTDNGDQSITVSGTNSGGGTAYFNCAPRSASINNLFPAGTYTISGLPAVGSFRRTLASSPDGTTWTTILENTFTLSEDRYIQTGIALNAGETVNNQVVKLQIERGETATEWMPYFVDLKHANVSGIVSENNDESMTDTYTLPNTVELMKYDSIDIDAGKKFVQSAVITQDTPFTAEQLAQYTDYVISQDGKTLCYKTESATETDFSAPTGYVAYNGGTETISQGETDNSIFGANPTVTQKYFTEV